MLTCINLIDNYRYRCQYCKCSYQLRPSRREYSDELCQQALRLYLEQNGFRRTGRILGINAQTVANWVAAEKARQPAAMQPPEAEIVEMDELYAVHQKKQFLFAAATIDRTTRCLLSFRVCEAFNWEEAQRVLDALPMLD